jgi:hypothetical protein
MFAVVTACVVTGVCATVSSVVVVARVAWVFVGSCEAEHECCCKEGFDLHCRNVDRLARLLLCLKVDCAMYLQRMYELASITALK